MARPKVEFHKTAEGILASAQKHFLEKGFSGTSINDIAKDANINKSLIYHHYENKEGLWRAVKKRILEDQSDKAWETRSFNTTSLREFLDDFIDFRFYLYASHPELARLMQWQRIESHNESIAGVSTETKDIFLGKELIELQQKNELRSDIPLEMINYLIFSLASNCFLDHVTFLDTKNNQKMYLETIKEMLFKTLKSSRNT